MIKLSHTSLYFYAFVIPLMECVELFAGVAYQATHDQDRLDVNSTLMRLQLAWLIIAGIHWLVKRILSPYLFFGGGGGGQQQQQKQQSSSSSSSSSSSEQNNNNNNNSETEGGEDGGDDVVSYESINRRYKVAQTALESSNWEVLAEFNEEGASPQSQLVKYKVDSIKLVKMWPAWIQCLLISVPNIAIVGFAHLDVGITGVSATTQSPSFFVLCWTIIVQIWWNRKELTNANMAYLLADEKKKKQKEQQQQGDNNNNQSNASSPQLRYQ